MLWLSMALAVAAPPADEVVAEVCAGRTPCQLASHADAGTDAAAHRLLVVEVLLSDTPVGQARGAVFDGACHRFEHHLVRLRGEELVDTRKLLETCNDGYGASGIGEDQVTVSRNQFSHVQVGGSAWRWSEGKTWQLSPPGLLSQSSDSYWTMGSYSASTTWDWQTRSGAHSESRGHCGADELDEGNEVEAKAVELPRIPKQDGVGVCAARVDADDADWVVFGKPGSASDGAMTAAFQGKTLVVDVRDDRWITAADSWIKTDHLEIWVPEDEDPGGGTCADVWKAMQWGVGPGGKVYSGYGKAKASALSAEVEDLGDVRRWRVTFRKVPDRITVVFSDSDDGKSQERLIATSQLRRGDAYSLGFSQPFEAGCSPSDVAAP